MSLNEDSDKFKAIPEIIGVPSNANYEMNRIGKPNDRTKRLLKVDVTTKEHRDDMLKKAKILKDQSESWSYVYLKRDIHYVQYQEDKIIRNKMKSLKKSFPQKDIKIIKGKLLVDGGMVDKNTFFV